MSIVLDNCAFSTPLILYQTPKSYQLPAKPIKILPCRLFVSHINHTSNKCIFFLQMSHALSRQQALPTPLRNGNYCIDLPVILFLNVKFRHF